MSKFLDKLNDKLNTYNNLKIVSVLFDKKYNEITMKFLYNNLTDIKLIKGKISNFISEYFDTDAKVIVKCKLYYLDKDVIKNLIYNFIFENYSSILSNFSKNNIEISINNDIDININIIGYVSEVDFKNNLLDFLYDNVFENINLTIKQINIESNLKILQEKEQEFSNMYIKEFVPKYHKIEIINDIIGTNQNLSPIFLEDLKSSCDNVSICGKIKFVTKKTYIKKNKKGEEVQKEYLTFQINDNNCKLRCVYFPKVNDVINIDLIIDDLCVLLYGNFTVEEDKNDFKVSTIAVCKILEEEKETPKESSCYLSNEYKFCFPKNYINYEQSGLFNEQDKVCEYVKTHDIVVFDVETTGLDSLKNEIIEIGAVKLINGEISQTFSTLIKPSINYIPSEIEEITGINFNMVKDCLTIDKILPDFYLFCQNCDLVAYNISFDYRFINNSANKLGFNFDNKQIDALLIARLKVIGAKNYKLKTIATKVGVSLDNAHRAVHDAIATAKIFLKLNYDVDFYKIAK